MSSPAQPPTEPSWTTRGSAAYWRISVALFLVGCATFSLLYCVQPVLPVFAHDFSISASNSSLALSLATGFLAFSIVAAGFVSSALPRRHLIFGSLCLAALCNALIAIVPSWGMLLALRAAQGVALGGVPAVAMAYLAEEIEPRGLGFAMGLYVSGNAFGGMVGRVATGVLVEWTSWRVALGLLGGFGLLAAIGFFCLLPASRNFVPNRRIDMGKHMRSWAGHLKHRRLTWLFAIGFLNMGAFITVYNYASFRLIAPPYLLTQTQIGLIFSVYLFGIVASSTAGALADRHGRSPVLISGLALAILGVGLTLMASLTVMIGGIVLLTIGFFMAHSVSSSWVGRMALGSKAHAAALYLLAYYMGSSIAGSAGGWFWDHYRWMGITAFTGVLLAAALAIAIALNRPPARGEG